MEIKADVNAVLIGRILAAVITIMGFAYSVKAATDALSGAFWVFLAGFTVPLALAFVVVMVTEILRQMRQGEKQRG